VESSRSEETGGSGLGLAIARKIVEMHEGSLTAESGLDGTVFKLKLSLD
jgi:signal transduction histidine kinase